MIAKNRNGSSFEDLIIISKHNQKLRLFSSITNIYIYIYIYIYSKHDWVDIPKAKISW